ncbi:MAG: alpha-hydroxy-acid oxidizing protein [Proteobacteria bacterium]|nr:alpha-hydroxy-acid oxidizing protein [Burkholderiales bacterium]
MSTHLNAYNIFDLRDQALRRVPRGLFEFVDRGTEDEVSLKNNRSIFDGIRFKTRTLVDVSRRTQETTIFGVKHKMPLVIAPTGTAGLMWYEGEIALARAARAAGIPFTLATGSMTAMERVADEAGGDLWFQLYMWPDRSLSHELVQRAKAAGYKALVVTVDGVSSGNREYNIRNGFTIPFTFSTRNVIDMVTHPRWLFGTMLRYLVTTGMPTYANYPAAAKAKLTAGPMGRSSLRSDSISWADLDALRAIWPHKLIVKGMLDPADAAKAVDHGADGIDVSNHGGRNLDGIVSPIEALPEIVDAVGNRATVFMDSGIRRGSDVVKALALGADAVMVGRSTLYGVAAGGEAGAVRALEIFRDEISRVLALLGCRNLGDLGPQYLKLVDPTLRAPNQVRRPLRAVPEPRPTLVTETAPES